MFYLTKKYTHSKIYRNNVHNLADLHPLWPHVIDIHKNLIVSKHDAAFDSYRLFLEENKYAITKNSKKLLKGFHTHFNRKTTTTHSCGSISE